MSIIVRPITEDFKLEISHAGEKVIFTYRQLPYRIKNLIAGAVTSVKQGQIYVDTALSCFYHIKYAVKHVEGLLNADGSPYVLEFTDEKKEALTDNCADALLATAFNDKLIYASKQLLNSIPDRIINPVTGAPLEGVELVLDEQGLKKNL
jgi:hypothetical protein